LNGRGTSDTLLSRKAMLEKVKQQLVQGKHLITFTALRSTGQALGMLVPLVVARFFEPGLFASYSLAKMIVFFFTCSLIASSQRPFIVKLTNPSQSGVYLPSSAYCSFP